MFMLDKSMFKWGLPKFSKITEVSYEVDASIEVLIAGADPRELPQDLLDEAFSITSCDKAEFEWTCSIDYMDKLTEIGDLFQVTVVVTVGGVSDSQFKTLALVVRNIYEQSETLKQEVSNAGSKPGLPAEVAVEWAMISGVCACLSMQSQALLTLLETR